MPVITCIDDLKRLHQKRTPKMFWDYCESGSYTEQTFHENSSDFAKLRLRQRVARDLSGRVLDSTMAGQKVSMPVALSPPCRREGRGALHPFHHVDLLDRGCGGP